MSSLVQLSVRGPGRQLLAQGAFAPIEIRRSEDGEDLELFGRDDQGRSFALVIPHRFLQPTPRAVYDPLSIRQLGE